MVKDHKATLIKVDHSLQYHVQRAARICVNVPVPALVQNPDNVDYLAVLTEILLGAQTECVNAGCEDKPGALVPACRLGCLYQQMERRSGHSAWGPV